VTHFSAGGSDEASVQESTDFGSRELAERVYMDRAAFGYSVLVCVVSCTLRELKSLNGRM